MFLLFFSCQNQISPSIPPSSTNPSIEWELLLQKAQQKSDDGSILLDYDLIEENKDILEAFVVWNGTHGPISEKMTLREANRKIAFLFNAYNAAVIYGVLENNLHKNNKNVLDVSQGFWVSDGAGFFLGQQFFIDQEWISLFILEQQYILGTFQDPLLHAGMNCASKGCPPIRFWKEKTLKKDLKKHFENFINSPQGSKNIDGKWFFSELFQWYEQDFVQWTQEPNLCAYLLTFAEQDDLQSYLEEQVTYGCHLEFFEYDWALNTTKMKN